MSAYMNAAVVNMPSGSTQQPGKVGISRDHCLGRWFGDKVNLRSQILSPSCFSVSIAVFPADSVSDAT